MKVVRHYCVKLCRLASVWLDGFVAGLFYLASLLAMPIAAAAPPNNSPAERAKHFVGKQCGRLLRAIKVKASVSHHGRQGHFAIPLPE
jgi:hypothetical protein